MSEPLPPIEGRLRELVARERAQEEPISPARAEAMLSAVQTAAAAGAAGAAGAAVKAGITLSAAKLAGIVGAAVVAGAALGAGAHVALSPAPAPAPAPAFTGSAAPAPSSPASAAPLAAPELPSAAPAASPSTSPALRASARPLVSDLPQEQTLIDAARGGLASGRPDVVLDAVARHERLFPRGQLAEERDALRILALARSGRAPEASQRLARFRAAYPASALLPKLESAIP